MASYMTQNQGCSNYYNNFKCLRWHKFLLSMKLKTDQNVTLILLKGEVYLCFFERSRFTIPFADNEFYTQWANRLKFTYVTLEHILHAWTKPFLIFLIFWGIIKGSKNNIFWGFERRWGKKWNWKRTLSRHTRHRKYVQG